LKIKDPPVRGYSECILKQVDKVSFFSKEEFSCGQRFFPFQFFAHP
jgi:hypothetical protein